MNSSIRQWVRQFVNGSSYKVRQFSLKVRTIIDEFIDELTSSLTNGRTHWRIDELIDELMNWLILTKSANLRTLSWLHDKYDNGAISMTSLSNWLTNLVLNLLNTSFIYKLIEPVFAMTSTPEESEAGNKLVCILCSFFLRGSWHIRLLDVTFSTSSLIFSVGFEINFITSSRN